MKKNHFNNYLPESFINCHTVFIKDFLVFKLSPLKKFPQHLIKSNACIDVRVP